MEGPVTVLADDLTGACEIAAIGRKFGLRSIVSIDLRKYARQADLVVYDTETRLDSPAFASAKLTSTLHLLKNHIRPARLYKKVDSVLRGPISLELNLLAKGLGYERVLLVPANPALGRTIKNGYYRINATPLHETAFARDLHHPITSSWVIDLLGSTMSLAIHRCSVNEPVPGKGLVVCDTQAVTDFPAWLDQVQDGTLPAGAAAFFEYLLGHWLGQSILREQVPVPPDPPTLLISGTTSPDQIRILEAGHRVGGDIIPVDPTQLESQFSQILRSIANCLNRHKKALVYMADGRFADPKNAYLVRISLARIARHFIQAGAVRHLVVEGGATAASIASELDWKVFEAAGEWAQGTVSLKPVRSGHILFTMKPGSYPWPTELQSLIFGPGSPDGSG